MRIHSDAATFPKAQAKLSSVQNGGHPHLPQQWLQQIWQSIASELGLLVNCCPVVLDEALEFIKGAWTL